MLKVSSVRRRRRRLRITFAVIAIIGVVTAFALRSPSASGHWRSAEGYDTFQQAYREAMTEMPEPDQTLDLRTDFGMVRVYHFAGTGSDNGGDPRMSVQERPLTDNANRGAPS